MINLESKELREFILLKPLSPNIDATACSEFKGRVLDLINQGHNFFLLNLSMVEFVDSSGLGTLISILKTLKLKNGDIVLCELNNLVQNLFNLTRMNLVFTICPNEKEGLDSLDKIKKGIGASWNTILGL
jgi:anti-sigma B factor antagonist